MVFCGMDCLPRIPVGSRKLLEEPALSVSGFFQRLLLVTIAGLPVQSWGILAGARLIVSLVKNYASFAWQAGVTRLPGSSQMKAVFAGSTVFRDSGFPSRFRG